MGCIEQKHEGISSQVLKQLLYYRLLATHTWSNNKYTYISQEVSNAVSKVVNQMHLSRKGNVNESFSVYFLMHLVLAQEVRE